MLACRPMLSIAFATMAGAVMARHMPELSRLLPILAIITLFLLVWFCFATPKAPVQTTPLPLHYAEHILATPGFFASRGLNKCILLLCMTFFCLAGWRQLRWADQMSLENVPVSKAFSATLLARAPARDHAEETGRWDAPVVLTAVDGVAVEPVRLRLSGRQNASFLRGDVMTARVRLQAERPKLYPGAFDAKLWLERDGMAGTLWLASDTMAVEQTSPSLFHLFMRQIDIVRAKAIGNTLRYGGVEGPILAAMLYGYRDAMASDVRDAFRRVGIGHVLAISGLHVGLVVGLLWWLSGWIGWSGRWRAIACLILAIAYLGLSGGQVAAQRATLMAGIHLAGIAWGRRSDMLNSLGAAAFCITLLNPSAPMDISFQLSFTAVVFIYLGLYVPRAKDRPERSHKRATAARWTRVRLEILSLLRLSIATWFGLFPIIAAVFNQVNLIGLPINIIVIPLMSLVLQGGLLLPWLGWIPGFVFVCTLPSRLLTWLAIHADQLPGASFPAQAPSPVWTGLFYSAALLWLLRGLIQTHMRQRLFSRAMAALMVFAFVGLVFSMRSSPPPEHGRVAILPGSIMPVVVAESSSGEIAVFGTLSKSGLSEAGWLHSLRRSGDVSAMLVEKEEACVPPAFAYHYPMTSIHHLPLESDFADADAGWQPVQNAESIEYAVSRDTDGKLVWLAVRTGNASAVVTTRMAYQQFAWRLDRQIPGFDADLFCLRLRNRPPQSAATVSAIALTTPRLQHYPPGWFARWAYGVLVVTETVRGYTGHMFESVLPDIAE